MCWNIQLGWHLADKHYRVWRQIKYVLNMPLSWENSGSVYTFFFNDNERRKIVVTFHGKLYSVHRHFSTRLSSPVLKTDISNLNSYYSTSRAKLSFNLYSILLPIIKGKISTRMFQWDHKLSFKLYQIRLLIIQARSPLVCVNKITSYLSSFIRVNAKSTSNDLCSYASTRTKALFHAYDFK